MRKLVETLCNKITLIIRKENPEIDDQRAEIINYGLQLIVRRNTKNNFNFVCSLAFWGIKINNTCNTYNNAI